jgi:hypothetical protein
MLSFNVVVELRLAAGSILLEEFWFCRSTEK